MSEPRCPGQDMRSWKPEDIYDVACPLCQTEIEFWKDEPMRICPQCKKEVLNPRLNVSCTDWCKSANTCVGRVVKKSPQQNSPPAG